MLYHLQKSVIINDQKHKHMIFLVILNRADSGSIGVNFSGRLVSTSTT